MQLSVLWMPWFSGQTTAQNVLKSFQKKQFNLFCPSMIAIFGFLGVVIILGCQRMDAEKRGGGGSLERCGKETGMYNRG